MISNESDTAALAALIGSRVLPPIEATVRRKAAEGTIGSGIHTDEAAAKWGFKGALVPGIRIYEAALAPALELLGEEWFRRGSAHMRHRLPSYEGDALRSEFAEREGGESGLNVTVRNEAGDSVAIGTVMVDAKPASAPETPPRREPLPSFDAYPGTITPKHPMVVGPVIMGDEWFEETAFETAAGLSEGDPIMSASLAQRISTLANFEMYEHVTPGIHYSGGTRHFDSINYGDTVEDRGEIVRTYERNSRHYFDSRHVILTQRGVAAIVEQTVIYYQEPAK